MMAAKKKQRLSSWRGWRSLRHFVYAAPFYPLTLRGAAFKSLRALPPDPWPGDMAAAKAILSGGLAFTGPEKDPGKDAESVAALHGFNWLSDLCKLESQAARARAQELVDDWIKAHGSWSETSWRADVLGGRLSNWCSTCEFLLAGGNADFKGRFLKSISAQARHLGRAVGSPPRDSRAFQAIKGLVHCGVCLPENEGALETGLGLLGQEIERQILPDGGHFQRNPSLLLGVMRHLVDIRDALHAAQVEAPAFLQGAMDRMAPMLRGLRLGDGGLALFNGGGEEGRQFIDQVLAQAGAKGKALSNAPHTGFQRINAGRTTLIIDTGAPQSAEAAENAHAGALSFEMSAGKARLIVNCGAPSSGDPAWRAAARATAAHSTVCVDGACSSDFLPARDPPKVSCARRQAEGNVWLETVHEGYKESFGLTHERKFYLDSSGADFRGEDVLTGFGGKNFVLRFHLHPQVQASLAGDGASVLLKPPAGAGWRFHAAGGAVAIEESVYMGRPGPVRRCEQITVSGPLSGSGAKVKWALRRQDRRG